MSNLLRKPTSEFGKIHQLNARLILLLSEEISDPLVIKKIIDQIETEHKIPSNSLSLE